ncbi:hypothetical protein [Bauldia litoralis]|uniref:Gluconate 2-dehydrogenase subunit 3 n=1 Tax=Bauldia litoralis TaxID=665467 RepID=A0A1G6C957_9HYPH|nr:hypothetical protein [Bauldia litoralis]SDB29417.1 hypothetical protein SAMN02982931_02213 [Bauldia litoralis]
MLGTLIRFLIACGAIVSVLGFAAAAPGSGPDTVEADDAAGEAGERVMPGIPADGPLFPGNTETRRPFSVPAVAPTVVYDPASLPTPVRRLREQILEAAASGDIERIRPIIEANGEPPAFSYNDIGDDPIEYLRSLSTDPEGREILAVLSEMLETGYVHYGEGTPDEMYVWPYFAHYPVELLTGPQIVELLKIVYPGDYEDMKTFGTYLSYRVGLAPDGTWRYFLVGE